MKPLRHFFSRALGACKPGKGKAGSSLALVMMVGAALVIWVMCIMPLMATTGATAAKTEQSYDDYLDSRSSIEYCKSELQDIVTREMPYTFAVIRNTDADGKISYSAIKEMEGAATSNTYTTYVDTSESPTDDTKHKPQDNEEGDKVAAICAVGKDENGVYPITIKTYHNGVAGQSYSLSFTVSGSLLIFPESYKQNDALPLSDFAVVDGKMGANQVWNSDIDMTKAVVSGGTGDFTETLLPWKLKPEAGYADTGEYPAAFKKTANAAPADDSAIGEPLTDGEFTNENWIVPTAVSGPGNKPGEIWYKCDDGTNISVHLYKDDNHKDENITDSCTIYLNGVERKDKTVPAQEGYYCITVDYKGTGAYDPSENAVNILPASGLRMPNVLQAVATRKQEAPVATDYTISVDKNTDGTLKVTLNANEGVNTEGILYAYCEKTQDNNKVQVTWSESNEFDQLDAAKTWYFYACRPAEIKDEDADGVNVKRFYKDSDATRLGAVCPVEYASSLENGNAYAIVGESGGKSYAMNANRGSENGSLGSEVLNTDDGYIIAGPDGLNIPAWTATASESQWYLQNNGKYLTMTGSYDIISLFPFKQAWTFSLGVNTDPTNGLFTVTFDNEKACVSRSFTGEDWRGKPKYSSASIVLSGKSFTYAEGNNSTVKFLKVPDVGSAPSVTSPSDYQLVDDEMKDGKFVLDYKMPSFTYVRDHISPEAELETLYANGKEVTKLDPGTYYLTAQLKVGTRADGSDIHRYADLGMLTIRKSTDNSEPDLKINQSAEDDLTVTITTTAPAYDSKDKNFRNMLLFGYKAEGETEFHWYPADEGNKQGRTFRLMPGNYTFAVRRFGDSTYDEAVTTSGEYEITFRYEELTEDNKVEFLYTFDKDSGTVVWYKLPARILPCRVQLVFGSRIGDTSINWSTTYTDGVTTFYGVVVEESNYPNLGAVLQVPPPVGITKLNGHTTSMMRGSSLYFMGRDSSINTYGNSVYLTADLVVLNKGIGLDDQGRGHVYVTPHSSGEGTPGDVLLFTVNDITCNGVAFKARTFYRLPKNTDLCNPNPTGVKELGSVETPEVKDLFRLGVYPEINLDIAYASDEQLAHVVSSETIRWTNGGVLSGQDNNNTNAGFVVCAYVSNINGSVSYKANRVLIATGDDSSHTLSVPANLTFTSRYLSIEADQVIGNGASFTIKNLGQDSSFVQSISNALGLTGYSSKTLQVDFERNTQIVSGDTMSNVERQICRYDDGDDDGADLFSATPQSLMAPYTTSEIRNLFSNKVSATVKTVDRYIALSCKDGSGSLDIGALVNCELDIYANYIFVDESVKEINVSSLFSNSDLKISSQESGYTTNEYLGLFKDHSAESYSGTLIYFEGDVYFTYSEGFLDTKTAKIEKGFYYVYAKDDGTSLKDLATNLFVGTDPNDNTAKKPYKIDPSSLKNYSVYIDSNGNISNAYVDTGIWDNTNTGLGGFSGGNVG